MSFSPRMVGGAPMQPGRTRARQGLELEEYELPDGLMLRVWRSFARPYTGAIAGLLGLIAVGSVLSIVPPWLIGKIVDTLNQVNADVTVRRGADQQLGWFAGGLITAALATGVVSVAQRYTSAWIGERLICDLRTELFNHVQRMPLDFFTQSQTGALISRLNNDVIGAQRAITGTFGTLLANVVLVIASVSVMATISVTLTAVTLTIVPLFVVVAKLVSTRLQRLTRESMDLNAEMNTFMTERFNVSGAMLAKLFGRPDEDADLFRTATRRVADIGVENAVIGRVFLVVLSLMGAIGTAASYWLGGRMVLTNEITTGQLITFGTLVAQTYQPLAALTNAPVEVLTALVSFDRVFEIVDLPLRITDPEDPITVTEVAGEVQFDHVTFAYPRPEESSLVSLDRESPSTNAVQNVLCDVSFTAFPGQTVALVGPSGAGKTTILSLVSRLYDVTQGSVKIDGNDVRDVSLSTITEHVGVVTQDPHLFHDTVLANLRYANPDAGDIAITTACQAAQIDDVIMRLPEGYDTVVGERGYRLSGGEKQRLAIARVLLKDPAIVVLDEATSHLDTENEERIQQALSTVLQGRTNLVIAHRLSTVVNADQILMVENGKITESGTHKELLSLDGRYADLFSVQFPLPEVKRRGHP